MNEILADFKAKATAAATPEEMWLVRDFLASKEREIREKYDYRYFATDLGLRSFAREERIREEQLEGFSDEKLSLIRRVVSL